MAPPVCCCAVLLRYLSRSRPRVRGQHPAFPAPSWLRGWSDEAKLGRIAPREREGVSASNCSLSSPGLTGRSSIPEAIVMEPRGRGVLDSPPSRGMTVSSGEPAHTSYSVIPTLGVIARLDRAIQYSETVVVQPRGRAVLDSPPQCASAHKAGNDSVIWRTSPYLILRHCERSEAIQNPSAVTVWIASLCSK